jgi:hypothetical protein
MNLISVKNIEHTVAAHGGDIITQEWTYPRAFHAEVMTHRDKSRNAESSRAFPALKKLDKTAVAPWIPAAFTRNQRGMQGGEALDGTADVVARTLWEMAFRVVEPFVRKLAALEVHKQYANRLAEPWATITIVITGTEWENMDALRAHPDAFPEFQELMWMAIEQRLLSTPRQVAEDARNVRNWHLPYVSTAECAELGLEQATKCSVARCARVSFVLQDGSEPNVDKDNELYDRLYNGGHMSPFEHQATPLAGRRDPSGNFNGWLQYRKTIPNEVRKFNYWDACEKAGRTPVIPRPLDGKQ